jgi:hypothetical protein
MDNNKEVIGRGKEEENNTGYKESKNQEEQKRKRGRRKKDEVQEQYEPKDQNKYFIDVSKNKDQRELIQNILNQANNKNYGREIILKDLVLIALPKITAKEIEKLQEKSLSEMERVSMAFDEYNKKKASNTDNENMVK